jgi:DNA invertase Pin-like site-specific DNA recombinase
MRLIGYMRVSQMRGRAGESFISTDVQRQQIEQYAAAMGHELVGWEEDLDKPGSTLNRPGIQAALATIAAGEADGVIAAKLDRLTRSIADLGRLLERAQAESWNLVAVDVGLDLRTPSGRLVAHVLGAVAEWELERRRGDWQEARARAVARGVHVASRSPTGYVRGPDSRLVRESKAAKAVRMLFRRRVAGDGWKVLADKMTATGILTPYGNAHWTAGAVKKVISNRVYLGEARSGSYELADAHEPLIDVELWDAAQAARPRPTSRVREVALLGGLCRCASCRHVLKSDSMNSRGEKLRMYSCRVDHAAGRCPRPVNVLARVLEPFVEEQVEAWLRERGPAGVAVQDGTHAAAVRERDAARAELLAYTGSETLTIAGAAAFEHGLAVRRARVDETERIERDTRPVVLPFPGGGTVELDEWYRTLPRAERAEVIGAVLDCVVVWPHRSGRPVSDRAQIVLRGDAPDGLPRRGLRVPLAGWAGERPPDIGEVAAEKP